jgi:hypothetical protein
MDSRILKETEKALQIEGRIYVEYAPKGGFVSSLVRDLNSKYTFWCPKSVVKNGIIAGWFLSKKVEEATSYFEGKLINSQILTIDIFY